MIRKYFLILLILLIFLVACKPNPGGKSCITNEDCVPLGGCEYGCWSKDGMPTRDRASLCGALPPHACACVNNECVETIPGLDGSGNEEETSLFKVEYLGKYSSSGGGRILDITYTVQNGEIISCEGTYSYPPSQQQQDEGVFENNVEDCDVNKLKSKDYNVPLNLVTNPKEKEGSGTVAPGGMFEWNILE